MMRTVCMQVISRKLFSGITCSTIKELQILIPWSKMKLKGSRKNKMRKSRTNNLVFTYYHNNIELSYTVVGWLFFFNAPSMGENFRVKVRKHALIVRKYKDKLLTYSQ